MVVRHERDRVAAHAAEVDAGAVVADQDDVPGTGRAVQCGLDALAATRDGGTLSGTVLVTYGDVPMLTGDTLADLVAAHEDGGHAVTVITADVADPTGYGRVLRDDARPRRRGSSSTRTPTTRSARSPRSTRASTRSTPRCWSRRSARVGRDNAQGEMYLTDVLRLAREGGGTVAAHRIDDVWQTEGVNDRVQLARMGAELNRRLVEGWMREGVTVVDPATTWVDAGATLARDVTLLPGRPAARLHHGRRGRHRGPGHHAARLRGRPRRVRGPLARRGRADRRRAPRSARSASCGPAPCSGPRARSAASSRPRTPRIGDGAKVPHLTYAGDATIGEGANIGAGTIFANYDGVAKHRTVVGRHSFVGSDSVLVAPVTVADGAYVAAGSTVTGDVPVRRDRGRPRPASATSRAGSSAAAPAPPPPRRPVQASSEQAAPAHRAATARPSQQQPEEEAQA